MLKKMEQIRHAIKNLISISEDELNSLTSKFTSRTFKRNEITSLPNSILNEVYFVNTGLVRIIITDNKGKEHTLHFAMENQFIADYPSYLLKQPSIYTLQAVEETQVVVLSRSAIEWAYKNLKEGQKLGRLIAEFYFIFQDDRVKNLYVRSPKQRYDCITTLFPNIHNRVPQHMIASYLGISPVHLSRLKKM
jgi:CRP-like cAMP-binding protein